VLALVCLAWKENPVVTVRVKVKPSLIALMMFDDGGVIDVFLTFGECVSL